MTNFVIDDTDIPGPKVAFDEVTQPSAAEAPDQYMAPEDYNTLRQASYDLRSYVVTSYPINVRKKGAKGDGVTNDYAPIQDALNQAELDSNSGSIFGGFVYCPRGLYINNTAPWIQGNAVGIKGDGAGATCLRAGNSFNGTALIRNRLQDGTQEYAFLDGLRIEGNKGGGAVCSVAVVDWVSLFINSYIHDVVILNGSSVGLRIAAAGTPGGCGPIDVDNVWVDGCTGHDVHVEDTVSNSGAFVGICFKNLTIEHQNNGSSAIYLKGLGRLAQCNFYNTHIEQSGSGTTRTGITIDGAAYTKFYGVQILASPNTVVAEGIKITNVIQNVGVEIGPWYNPNVIPVFIRDLKNGCTIGAINGSKYVTPDAVVYGGQRFAAATSGTVALGVKDTAGTDRFWVDQAGNLTGASNNGAGVDIKADTTNNRGWTVQTNAGGNVFEWLYPSGGGGVLRERYRTGNVDVRQIGTDGSQFFYQSLTVQGAALFQGNIGFYNTAASAKKTATGSRGSNAALASLLTQLAAYGLIIDSTTT